MTAIKDLDAVSERGKRTVQNGLATQEGLKMLKEFKFGEKVNIHAEALVSEKKESRILNLEKISANEIVIITIQPNLEIYSAEYFEEQLALVEGKEIFFERHFPDDTLLLYFLVLKNNNEITHMGFI
jgi:hypothetical protein